MRYSRRALCRSRKRLYKKHLEQVAADLHFEIVYSTIARPQGRGKIERLFGTLNTELLPELPGYLKHGKPTSDPKLSLAELNRTLDSFLISTCSARTHREIHAAPQAVWSGDGCCPLLRRLFLQIERVLQVNELTVITDDVVNAARSTLVIGVS